MAAYNHPSQQEGLSDVFSNSSVKILGKHDVKQRDQLVEDVKGVGREDDPFGLGRYAIDTEIMGRTFEEAAKVPSGVSIGK